MLFFKPPKVTASFYKKTKVENTKDFNRPEEVAINGKRVSHRSIH